MMDAMDWVRTAAVVFWTSLALAGLWMRTRSSSS